MAVDDKNDKYTLFKNDWDLMSDVMEGERQVKSKAMTYLPVPPGLKDNSGCLTGAVEIEKYNFLLSFGELKELAAPTSRMITGVITHKQPIIKLPSTMDFLYDSATPDGLNIYDFYNKIVKYIVRLGRYGVLCDVPTREDGGGNPYFVGYEPKDIWNWYEENVNQRKVVTFISNDESYVEFDYNESYSKNDVSRLRVLVLKDGVYTQEIHGGDSKNSFAFQDSFEPTDFRGQTLDEIPYVFFGSTCLDPNPDQIPLIGVGRNVIAAFRKSAVYGRSIYMTGDPTVVIKGMSSDHPDMPTSIGGGSIWTLPSHNNDTFFLEYEGKSIESQRQAIQDNLDEAYQAGARLLADAGAGESGEALSIRVGSQMATAKTISIQAASGMEKLLKYCARFVGADPEQINVEPNLDFVTNRMSSDELLKFTQAINQGAPISKASLHALAKQGELTTMEYEEEEAKIEEESLESLPRSGENVFGMNDDANDE